MASNELGKGFVERLLSVIGEEKPYTWAARVQIPKSTLHNCLSNKSVPSAKYLLRISETTGRSINWLLTGSEKAGGKPHPPQYDEVVQGLIRDVLRLPANKRAMVRDLVKRILSEEKGKKG